MNLLVHWKSTKNSVFYSKLIVQSLRLTKQKYSAKLIHAHLIKLGFNSWTYLGNQCVDLYGKVGLLNDAFTAFDDIAQRNTFSWNIYLNLLIKAGDINNALYVFDQMSERDVVSWNSMISGYVSSGFWEIGVEMFSAMQRIGIRPSVFSFSILVSSLDCALVGMQMHCVMIKIGVTSLTVVVGNSLIDMYSKNGLLDHAIHVFQSMIKLDIVSWNSLISGCNNSGFPDLALDLFLLMKHEGYMPDGYTMSAVITACSNLHKLEKGNQILCHCIKIGSLLNNTIVSSAAIDFLSKCNRLEDSIRIFDEFIVFDSALCNSMISSYTKHGLGEKAFITFVFTLQKNIKPTEFTFSSLLKSTSFSLFLEQGSQVHSLVIKSGYDSDRVVASSLVDMYSKHGLPQYSLKVFKNMTTKDLISWNTIILGLTSNGIVDEPVSLFIELLRSGFEPDHITYAIVLLACNYGLFVEHGNAIFSSIVSPKDDHYDYVVEMLCRAGKLAEVVSLIKKAPFEPTIVMWESILGVCRACGDMELMEIVAETMMELRIESNLAYSVLEEAYEKSGRWERLIRVRRLIGGKKRLVCRSWIGFRNIVHVFEPNQEEVGSEVDSVLKLLNHEMHNVVFLNQFYVDLAMIEEHTYM